MDLYNTIAQWVGWPALVAVLILLGSSGLWLLRSRLDFQKEINDKLNSDLVELHSNGKAAAKESVRYGSVIKLNHDVTGLTLHSHSRNYEHPGSSGQQQVTAFMGSNEDDLWLVKGPHNFPDNYNVGEAVLQDDIIRLEHVNTERNLHSHSDAPSPVSGQQEVTGYGKGGTGDTNDNWRVDLEYKGVWRQGDRVRFIHQQTDVALHSHSDANLPNWGCNQQEVTGFSGRDRNDWWRAAVFDHRGTV